jgi:GT2 family glycosyltransferase
VSTSQDISIIVVTYNRVKQLQNTLAMLTQFHRGSPVIVVDNASTDGTVPLLCNEFPHIQFVRLDENRGTGARTIGVSLSRTPFVAFNDDDSWLEKDALSKAAELFDANPKLGLIAACVLVGEEQKLDPVCVEVQNSPLKKPNPASFGIPVLGFLACGSIVRKEAFLEVSGFEERFGIGGEEQMLAVDLAVAGWEVSYFNEIVAFHYPQVIGERAGRKQTMIRNDLWLAWLRRPIHVIVSKTMWVIKDSFSSLECKKALIAAIKGIPWVIRKRRRVTPWIEKWLVLLDQTKKAMQQGV